MNKSIKIFLIVLSVFVIVYFAPKILNQLSLPQGIRTILGVLPYILVGFGWRVIDSIQKTGVVSFKRTKATLEESITISFVFCEFVLFFFFAFSQGSIFVGALFVIILIAYIVFMIKLKRKRNLGQ